MLELDKIHCGDNCDLLGQLPRECIDLVVTSPPYDDLRTYGGHSWDFFGVAWQLKRVLKPGGVIVWVVADATKDGSETGSSMEQALHFKRLGLNLHDTMIYEKIGMTLNHNRYEQEHEFMFVFSKGRPNVFLPLKTPCLWFGKDSDRTGQNLGEHNEINKKSRSGNARTNINPEKIKGNIWRYSTGFGHSSKDKIAFEHPAIFPEKLVCDHIVSWSNPGDVVLDPFNGSGTTVKMAKELGRRFLGLEINPEYCAIAERRLAQETLALEGG